MKNLYQELGLKKNATKKEIKASYRALVKKHHPDTGGEKERFLAIQNAWETLNDPIKKENYDKQLYDSHSLSNELHINLKSRFHSKKDSSSAKDKEVETWINDIYKPINRLINQIIKPLNHEIKENTRIDVMDQRKVSEIINLNEQKQLSLDNNAKLKTSLIVASDGVDSQLAKAFGIRKKGWEYKQRGLVCAVNHEYSSDNTAYQYFLPEGPLAILPIKNNTASIVWTESVQNASTISQMDDAEYLSVLQNRFGDFLGKLELTGKRLSFPLKLSISEKYVSEKFAVIGDAAHVYHPIAGQGLNAGMRDIAALVDVISSAKERGEDFSSTNVLNRYQQWRRFDNQALGFATDNLNKIFSSYDPLLSSLKNVGIKMIEKSNYAKRAFMRQAAGLNGDLPKLMR